MAETDDGLRLQASIDFIADGIGGVSKFLEHCAISDSERLQTYITTYKTLSTEERVGVTLQDLCVRAGLKPAEVMSDFVATVILQQNNLALLISALSRPKVMQASIETALIPGLDGVPDRKFQFELGGLLKSGINIVQQLGLNIQAGELPSFEEDSARSVKSVQAKGDQLALPEPLQGVVLSTDKDMDEREAVLIPSTPDV